LAVVLDDSGDLAGAVANYCRAIEVDPKKVEAHYNLGNVLGIQGDSAGAVVSYHRAIELEPNFAEAHCNVGHMLLAQGRFAESLAAYRRGHELGNSKPGWKYPSGQWVRHAERLVELDVRLPRILRGDQRAADADRLDLIDLCTRKPLYT